jgi:hypothetical protein
MKFRQFRASAEAPSESMRGYPTVFPYQRQSLLQGKLSERDIFRRGGQFKVEPAVLDGQRQSQRLAELTGYEAPRVMLHAHKLAFLHPQTGRKLSFKAPRPRDFQDAVKFLAMERGG